MKQILKPIGHKQPKEKHLTDEKIDKMINTIIKDNSLTPEDRHLIELGLMAAKEYYEWKK